jgi:hypothetical protein
MSLAFTVALTDLTLNPVNSMPKLVTVSPAFAGTAFAGVAFAAVAFTGTAFVGTAFARDWMFACVEVET